LWDWREHFLGVSSQAPHLVIDLGGLLAIGLLAFSGWTTVNRTTVVSFYVVLAVVALITLGPFVLMMSGCDTPAWPHRDTQPGPTHERPVEGDVRTVHGPGGERLAGGLVTR